MMWLQVACYSMALAIWSARACISSGDILMWWWKLRSASVCMGTRWMWAWGTSSPAVELFVEVEDVVDFFLRDAEHVAFYHGVDIEEGKAVVGFGNFVAGYFAGYDT